MVATKYSHALLVRRLHNGLAGNTLPTAVDALAVQSSQPVHRDNLPGRRVGNDRLAGSSVDREVT